LGRGVRGDREREIERYGGGKEEEEPARRIRRRDRDREEIYI
jgi:hypothetical protein